MDVIYIGAIVAFFAVSIAFVSFCARLSGKGGRS